MPQKSKKYNSFFIISDAYNDIFWFLEKEYRPEYYYWEIIIFGKKFLIIFVVTFKEFFNMETRMLSLIMILIMFIYLNFTLKPYKNKFLTGLDIKSLIISLITAVVGISIKTEFIKDKSSSLVIVVIFINSAFGAYLFLYFLRGLDFKFFKSMIVRSTRSLSKLVVTYKNPRNSNVSQPSQDGH